MRSNSSKFPEETIFGQAFTLKLTIFKFQKIKRFFRMWKQKGWGENIEKNSDVRIKCHKCGNEYAMDMMRMDSNGKNLVCRNCLERKVVKKQETDAESKTQKSSKQDESPMKEYFCKGCKYSFKRAKHLVVSTCPYCDSSSIMIKGSTSRIIADASKMKGDF